MHCCLKGPRAARASSWDPAQLISQASCTRGDEARANKVGAVFRDLHVFVLVQRLRSLPDVIETLTFEVQHGLRGLREIDIVVQHGFLAAHLDARVPLVRERR